MNQYNCRHPNYTLKFLPPGKTKEECFCTDCPYTPYKGPNCLFKSRQHESPKLDYHWQSANERPHRRHHPTQQEMLDAIKNRWLELGRPPLIRDLGPNLNTMSGHTIITQFPGGFSEARRQAADQLGFKLEFKCNRCDQSFTTAQGRGSHQYRCKQPQTKS